MVRPAPRSLVNRNHGYQCRAIPALQLLLLIGYTQTTCSTGWCGRHSTASLFTQSGHVFTHRLEQSQAQTEPDSVIGVRCGSTSAPRSTQNDLCFGVMQPISKLGLPLVSCILLGGNRLESAASLGFSCPATLTALGAFSRLHRIQTRVAGHISLSSKLEGSAWPIKGEDAVGSQDEAETNLEGKWTAAIDARGTPLLIEAANGAVPLMRDEDDDADLQIQADEEFEFGWWAPPQSSRPSDPTEELCLSTPLIYEGEITHWRDGEMESELGRLEMSACEDRVPSLMQMNKALHLCCKAVYKGLGQAGLTKGLRVLNLMWTCGVAPNGRSFDLLLDAAIGAASQGNKEALFIGVSITLNMCALGVAPRIILVNQLIKQVLKATGNIDRDYSLALKVVDAMSSAGVRLDIYTYNSLMAATALQPDVGPRNSLDLMAHMRRHKVRADIVTYNAFLHTCAKSCHLYGSPLVLRGWRMLQVLRTRPRGLKVSVISYNAVAHVCARAAAGAPAETLRALDVRRLNKRLCGEGAGAESNAAWQVRAQAHHEDGASHACDSAAEDESMAVIYTRGQLLEKMMSLVSMMREDGIEPDRRSFSTLLHGLSRGLDRMTTDYAGLLAQHESDAHAGPDSKLPHGRSRHLPGAQSKRNAGYKRSGNASARAGMQSTLNEQVLSQVVHLCQVAEAVLVAMTRDYKLRPDTTNYKAVLDMYRAAARLDLAAAGFEARKWPSAALSLLNKMRSGDLSGKKAFIAESIYVDVLEICASAAEQHRPPPKQRLWDQHAAANSTKHLSDAHKRLRSMAAGEFQVSSRASDGSSWSVMEVVMQVVDVMKTDGVPLNPAAVGFIVLAAKRESSLEASDLALSFFLSLDSHLRSKQVYTSMISTLSLVDRPLLALALLQHAQDEGVQPDEIMYGVCLQALRGEREALEEFRRMILDEAQLLSRRWAALKNSAGPAPHGADMRDGSSSRGGRSSAVHQGEALNEKQINQLLLKVDKSISFCHSTAAAASSLRSTTLRDSMPLRRDLGANSSASSPARWLPVRASRLNTLENSGVSEEDASASARAQDAHAALREETENSDRRLGPEGHGRVAGLRWPGSAVGKLQRTGRATWFSAARTQRGAQMPSSSTSGAGVASETGWGGPYGEAQENIAGREACQKPSEPTLPQSDVQAGRAVGGGQELEDEIPAHLSHLRRRTRRAPPASSMSVGEAGKAVAEVQGAGYLARSTSMSAFPSSTCKFLPPPTASVAASEDGLDADGHGSGSPVHPAVDAAAVSERSRDTEVLSASEPAPPPHLSGLRRRVPRQVRERRKMGGRARDDSTPV